MGINLGGNFGNLGQQNNMNGGAPILNLQKNDILDLTKRNPGLKSVVLGAGWDIAMGGADFDIDIAAFLLDANNTFSGDVSNVIFFNNKVGRGIELGGDNRTGAGSGDDETIKINLEEIDQSRQKIVFVVTIHNAAQKRQTFGMVNNSYVRLVDEAQGKELCRFNLKDDSSTATSVIFAELYRTGLEWQFKAVGEGKMADLNGVLAMFQ